MFHTYLGLLLLFPEREAGEDKLETEQNLCYNKQLYLLNVVGFGPNHSHQQTKESYTSSSYSRIIGHFVTNSIEPTMIKEQT